MDIPVLQPYCTVPRCLVPRDAKAEIWDLRESLGVHIIVGPVPYETINSSDGEFWSLGLDVFDDRLGGR